MGTPARIVGREREVACIRDLVDALPTGGVMLIEGEAGIGKSSLIDVACARATADGATTFRVSADEFSTGRPFGLMANDLRSPQPDGTHPDLDAVLAGFERLSGGRPLLLAFDDLQWADRSSLSMLAPLIRRIVPAGTAVVLAYRTWPRPAELDQLIDRLAPLAPTHLHLGPMSDAETRVLAKLELGRNPSRALLVAVLQSGGNPFYTLSMLSALRAQGRLRVNGPMVELDAGEQAGTMQRIVVQRVHLLGADALKLLRTAAVLGRTFDLQILARLVNHDIATLADLITDAISAGILETAGHRLAFRHDLVREALQNDLSLPIRMALHRHVVGILTDTNAPAGDLVPYLLRADLRASDVDLLVAASQQATPEAGAQLLDRAIALVPESDPRHRELAVRRVDALLWAGRAEEAVAAGRLILLQRSDGDELEVYDLFTTIAHALFLLGRADEAVDTWPWFPLSVGPELRAGELAEVAFASLFAGRLAQAREFAEQARSLSDDHTSASIVATVLAWVAMVGGDVERALVEADRAVETSRLSGESARRLGPYLVRAMIRDSCGDAEGAADDIRMDLLQADDLASAVRLPFHHAASATGLFRAGRWDEAQAEVDAGLAAGDDLHVHAADAALIATAALLALSREGIEIAAVLIATARHGQLGADQAMWVSGLIAELSGDLTAAVALFGLVADIGIAVGSNTSAVLVGADLVRCANAIGDVDRVRATIQAVHWAEHSRSVPIRAHHRWMKGLAHNDASLIIAAAELLAPIRPFEAARARHDAARSLMATNPTAARVLALEALSSYETLGATTFTTLVRADLASSGIRLRSSKPAALRHGWESLTGTERQVLSLLAEGLSNATIADQLIMSRRTVESHLAHVYSKVGISSRVQLVRHLMSSDAWREG